MIKRTIAFIDRDTRGIIISCMTLLALFVAHW